MSDIRAQFPMYADVPDDQLLVGIRRKYYSDIPADKFASMIDYDTERQRLGQEVTDSMGTVGRLTAGIGKGMTDIAQGVGQTLGLQSRQDVKDKRAIDSALQNTTAGKVGSVVGNVAALAPAMFIPGAATLPGAAVIGAGTGALAPSQSTGETLANTAIGAVAGPAGLLVGRGLNAGVQAAKSLVAPFTKKGQEQIAAQTLQTFAKDPQAAAAAMRTAQPLVPGSNPTMAQASMDPGLAQLERTLVNNPETGPALADQYAAQRVARLDAIQKLAGNAATRESAVNARAAATEPLYQQFTNAVYQVDSKLGDLLQRPIVQQAVARAQRLAANQGNAAPLKPAVPAQPGPFIVSEGGAPLVDLGTKGTPATMTGKGLQDLKMALDDMLSDPMAGIGKNEANAVKSIRKGLVDWMENANPDFRQARTTFADKSKPINTMDVANALMEKLQPALARYGASTKEHAAAYAQALEAAKETVKKSTGINRPMDEVIDQQAKQILENVAKDLARKSAADEMGRAVGSNTAQNLAAQNLLRRTLGPTGLPQSWAESNALQAFLSPYTGIAKLAGSENAVMNRLSQAALNPQDAANLLTMMQQQSRIPQRAIPLMPAVSLGYSRQQ